MAGEGREPAQLFMDNFKQYSDTEAGARSALAGPQPQKSAVEARSRPAGRPGADLLASRFTPQGRSASPVRR